MEIEQFISNQAPERQNILTKIHQLIIDNDASATAVIEVMMRMEMIIYKVNGTMKYGLASGKKHISLHLLPIYMSQPLHEKYMALLTKASFQKGCINFINEDEMPLDIVRELIIDSSKVDLLKIREDYLNSKKASSKKNKDLILTLLQKKRASNGSNFHSVRVQSPLLLERI